MISCNGEQREPELNQINIGTFSNAVDYAPFIIAKRFGWFEDNQDSIKVGYSVFQERSNISDRLEEGELHMIFAAAPPLIITKAQGAGLKIVDISCTLQQEIVTQNDLPINTIKDLRGQSVAVLLGTSSHYGLLNSLEAYGMDANNVNIIFRGPGAAKAMFEEEEIEAWAVWPPFIEQQVVNGNGIVLKGSEEIIQSVIAMSEDFLNNNPSVAREMLNVVRRAKKWILDNPEEARLIVSDELGYDLEVVELAWGKHNWAARLTPALLADIDSKIDFLAEQDLLRLGYEERIQDVIDTSWGGNEELSSFE